MTFSLHPPGYFSFGLKSLVETHTHTHTHTHTPPSLYTIWISERYMLLLLLLSLARKQNYPLSEIIPQAVYHAVTATLGTCEVNLLRRMMILYNSNNNSNTTFPD